MLSWQSCWVSLGLSFWTGQVSQGYHIQSIKFYLVLEFNPIVLPTAPQVLDIAFVPSYHGGYFSVCLDAVIIITIFKMVLMLMPTTIILVINC